MYNFKEIEQFSQKFWQENKVFETKQDDKREKFYVLDMFPYPSGDGLHVGHVKGYSATDIIAHYKRLKDFNVLHPMGWDAFGLPAENYAIKVKKNPKDVVATNVARFKNQMNDMGFSYDWSREINTTDPNYYRWTQWIFLQLYKKGLAYEDTIPINFCPSCKTGLANEEVVSGECERCGTKVEKKNLKQWILGITKYADRLLEDLNSLDWPEPIKEMQKNWIGRSEGSNIFFNIKGSEEKIEVYTTRADTLFGCTYLVVAPEHKIIEKNKEKLSNFSEVSAYIDSIKSKTELERTDLSKEKTGVKLEGIFAINPINGKEVPIFVADYVLYHYGTGAVMAVPAHDQRDFEFAKKYNLEIVWVVGPNNEKERAYIDYGKLENSGKYTGLDSNGAKKQITADLERDGLAKFSTNYKLRDWIFSRQRYWGEPIPIIHCHKCGVVAVPEEDLPVELPDVENYEPSGDGTSPLSKISDWVEVACPKCGSTAKRETNTMPQWAGSCWYYLRYLDPGNEKELVSESSDAYFSPVDFYIGGAEHAVLHLLYARFWHKVLFDIGVVKEAEPFKKLKNVGLILAPDRQKMSKSRGNVINPDEVIASYGVDALRMYEMFIGPFDQPAVWSTNGVVGTYRLLEKVSNSFTTDNNGAEDIEIKLRLLIKNIEEKIEKTYFNTAVSDFMKFSNDVDLNKMSKEQWKKFLIVMSPFAPHICEYLFSKYNSGSIFHQRWPKNDYAAPQKVNYVVQVNGKKRAEIKMDRDLEKNEVLGRIYKTESISRILCENEVKNVIFVNNKLVNFVI